MKPLFIVFEGLDGAGSTTQAKFLCEKLDQKGINVRHTSEPTNRKIGTLVREVLNKKWKLLPEGLQLLFCADRAEHLTNEIKPCLKEGISVVSDRYLLSTLAFGGINLDLEWLKKLNQYFRQPDLTFLLDVPVKKCLERIVQRGAPQELFEKKETLEKVWQNYLALAKSEKNIYLINGEKPQEKVAADVWTIVEKRLKREE